MKKLFFLDANKVRMTPEELELYGRLSWGVDGVPTKEFIVETRSIEVDGAIESLITKLQTATTDGFSTVIHTDTDIIVAMKRPPTPQESRTIDGILEKFETYYNFLDSAQFEDSEVF